VSVLGCGLYMVRANSPLNAGFNAAAPGMARDQVISMMGSPTSETPGCRDAATWLGQPLADKTCTTELSYDAKVLPKFWTIGFDEKGLAIAKYEYVSP
jgi:hypothetical protein